MENSKLTRKNKKRNSNIKLCSKKSKRNSGKLKSTTSKMGTTSTSNRTSRTLANNNQKFEPTENTPLVLCPGTTDCLPLEPLVNPYQEAFDTIQTENYFDANEEIVDVFQTEPFFDSQEAILDEFHELTPVTHQGSDNSYIDISVDLHENYPVAHNEDYLFHQEETLVNFLEEPCADLHGNYSSVVNQDGEYQFQEEGTLYNFLEVASEDLHENYSSVVNQDGEYQFQQERTLVNFLEELSADLQESYSSVAYGDGEYQFQQDGTLVNFLEETTADLYNENCRTPQQNSRTPKRTRDSTKNDTSDDDTPTTKRQRSVEERSCTICLDTVEDSIFDSTACQHWFHENCLETWFKYSNTCPICRFKLKDTVTNHSELSDAVLSILQIPEISSVVLSDGIVLIEF